MSGVEAAGFILAAIPLVVSAVEHYADGVRSINRWRKYDREVKSLCRRLRSEEELFRNTCELLLRDIVSSEQELETLVSNPAGAGWSDPDLERRLQEKLSARSYSVYREAVEDMQDIINAIRDRMGIENDGKASSRKNTMIEIVKLMKRKQKPAGASSSFFQRSKFAVTRKGFDDLMDNLRLNNDTLDRLVNQSNELEPSRQERRRRKEAQFFKHVRECAAAMFDAVSTALSCTCPETHTLSLSLSSRGSRMRAGKVIRDENDIDFPVIISHDVKNLQGKSAFLWSEIHFRLAVQEDEDTNNVPVVKSVTAKARRGTLRSVRFAGFADTTSKQSSQSFTATEVVKPKLRQTDPDQPTPCSTISSTQRPASRKLSDLCQALRSLDTNESNHCLGLLVARSTSFQVLPSTLAHDVLDFESCFVSLRTVLFRKEMNLPQLFRADKLRIAVTVASSVLQLHDSSWLENNWSANSVFFIRRKTRDLFEQAYVSRPILAKDTLGCASSKNKAPLTPYIRNSTLFSLGILLIELCLGKTIEQLRLPEDNILKSTTDAMVNWCTAERLLRVGQLSKEASLRYHSAVSRCIHCDFGQKSSSLENDQFRQAVYDDVVAPLEQDLMAFEGPLGT